MSTIAITVTDSVTPETFAVAAAEGKILFHTERADGTYRRMHYLANGTRERETADWVLEQREQGITMRTISRQTHTSVPTVRRMLNDLALTIEIEEADAEELAEWLHGAEEAQE